MKNKRANEPKIMDRVRIVPEAGPPGVFVFLGVINKRRESSSESTIWDP